MGRPRCGGETSLWWGNLAVVGRPRCGGETRGREAVDQFTFWEEVKGTFFLPFIEKLWWGDPAVVRRPRCGGETPLWSKREMGTFLLKNCHFWFTAQYQKFRARSGGETLWWGERIRCGGETPLWGIVGRPPWFFWEEANPALHRKGRRRGLRCGGETPLCWEGKCRCGGEVVGRPRCGGEIPLGKIRCGGETPVY